MSRANTNIKPVMLGCLKCKYSKIIMEFNTDTKLTRCLKCKGKLEIAVGDFVEDVTSNVHNASEGNR